MIAYVRMLWAAGSTAAAGVIAAKYFPDDDIAELVAEEGYDRLFKEPIDDLFTIEEEVAP